MKTTIKVLIILLILTAVASSLLLPSLFAEIDIITMSFYLTYRGWLAIAFTSAMLIFSIILVAWFLKRMKLATKLFVITVPITTAFISLCYFVLALEKTDNANLVVTRDVLRISAENNNSWLWVVALSGIYLLLLLLSYYICCRPISRVQKALERLGDGYCVEQITVGGGGQFANIQHSLNKINDRFLDTERAIKKTNTEYEKFIPKQFVKFFGKKSVLELELGSQITKKGTTLFCDIRNSTAISNSLSLEENFNCINSYLNLVAPVVRRHSGFIDKYLGDGLLCVFASAERAMECGHNIIRQIQRKNLIKSNCPRIDVGISISTGDLVFGVVGDSERKSLTIISDAVNLGGKMEEINKKLGSLLIFSKSTLNALSNTFPLAYRYIGAIEIPSAEGVSVFESLEGYPKTKRDKLFKNKTDFEKAVRLFQNKKFEEAKSLFMEVYKNEKDDRVCYEYYNACAIESQGKSPLRLK